MIDKIERNRNELETLCRKYGVRQLDLFGSATCPDEFDPSRSDLDFLVEFRQMEEMGPADQYFGLLEELEELFGGKIDLVSASSMRNPYFIKSVNETRQVLYAS